MTRLCPKCNQTKNPSEFYNRPDRNGKQQSYCKTCNKNNVIERQRKFKKLCIDHKGGKCEKCGYSKYFGALDFHHKDPDKKIKALSAFNKLSWEKNKVVITEELDKCLLLCANCHREEHGKIDP